MSTDRYGNREHARRLYDDDILLPTRACNIFYRAGIHSVEQICALSYDELLAMKGMGKKLAAAICDELCKQGLHLRKSIPTEAGREGSIVIEGTGLVAEDVQHVASAVRVLRQTARIVRYEIHFVGGED